MISAVRAAPKIGFHGVRLGCGDIHALKRRFILTISLSLYSLSREDGEVMDSPSAAEWEENATPDGGIRTQRLRHVPGGALKIRGSWDTGLLLREDGSVQSSLFHGVRADAPTTPSSVTAEAGASPAWRAERRWWKQAA